MHVALFLLDLVLLLLASLRVTRLVTTDNLPGQWWIIAPLQKRAYRHQRTTGVPRWAKYLDGLQCPFCVGFWIGLVGLLLLAVLGGPGHSPEWLRYLMGAFALNYCVGHAASRLD
jgi:hypothetical protein